GGSIKNTEGQVVERESAYNYIQVIREDSCNYLLLNEGQAAHSFKCDEGLVPYVSVWSAMLAAPYFNQTFNPPSRAAVIGLAGGTIPEQFLRVFPDMTIDGIEIDPEIIDIGRDYFSLDDPRIRSIAADGRFGLNQLSGSYDVITIDAYRVPYIPWHMTTIEFFQEVQAQLSPDGVVAINVGRVPEDRRLIEALTATMLEVYPVVYTVDIPGTLNTILYAPQNPEGAGFEALSVHFSQLEATADPLVTQTLLVAINNQQPTVAGEIVFTDNRAPVETIVDSLVVRYLLRSGLGGLPAPIN
ncbi:MAG: fused MFS/spermidine synthase, partial [Chloroflexota bacterium]